MQLLPETKVKENKAKGEQEKEQRIKDLNTEITSITKRVNDMREEEKVEKARINRDLATHRDQVELEKSELNTSLVPLRNEVKELEARKAEALKPIEVIKAEAEKVLSDAKEKDQQNAREQSRLATLSTEISDQLEEISDRKQELDEREEGLNTRESGIAAEEKRLKESEESLNKKWSDYHLKVDATNEWIASQKLDIENDRRRNATVAEGNAKEKDRLAKEDKRIKDLYVALDEAKKHLGIK